MFQVIQRSYNAPKSKGGKYRRPVRVLVVSQHKGCYRSNDPAIVREWCNVDSRYDGPNSAYGQAMAAARQLCDSLNHPAALTQGVAR